MAQLDLLNSSPIQTPLPLSSDATLPPKATGAYKNIREVAEELDVPQHVLRFWESNFPQVKPSRMRGSRRYYRPEDVAVLKTIKSLLYQKGYTIKGAKQAIRSGQEAIEAAAVTPVAPQPKMAATAPVASSVKPTAARNAADTQSLVTELRVLKSMLTSLL